MNCLPNKFPPFSFLRSLKTTDGNLAAMSRIVPSLADRTRNKKATRLGFKFSDV